MVGLVLCGGQSTRMGSDKGLLLHNNQSWANLAASKLSSLGLDVFVSVNKQQAPKYTALFHPQKLIVDKEELNVKGPLLGLLSALTQLPGKDFLVIACDMKDMTTDLLQQLRFQYEKGDHEAYVYSAAGKHQPLCAIYTNKGLQKIYDKLIEGTLAKYSMMYVLDSLETKYLEIKKEEELFFNNYNQPADLP